MIMTQMRTQPSRLSTRPLGRFLAAVPRAAFLLLALPLAGNEPLSLGNPTTGEPARYFFSGNLLLNRDIVIEGPVEIVVRGDLNPNGNDIRVKPGGQLTLYLNSNLNMHGGARFINEGKAANLRILGTRTSGQQDFVVTDSQQFNGAVYAPRAHVMFNGGDGVYYGAVTAKNITFNARNVHFHFDEALRNLALTVNGFEEQVASFSVVGYKALEGTHSRVDVGDENVPMDAFVDQFFNP
jgi:hypothetical protein